MEAWGSYEIWKVYEIKQGSGEVGFGEDWAQSKNKTGLGWDRQHIDRFNHG